MANYLNLPEGSAAASQVGLRLQAEAEDFKQKAQDLLTRIQEKDEGRPWGGDKAGKAFETQYHQPIEGAGPLAQALQDRLRTAGDPLHRLGGNVVKAMGDYDAADVTGAAEIAGAA